jgi:seryl-tRNA synthetase
MLDAKFIRENIDLVKQKLDDRGVKLDLEQFLELDKKRREMLQEIEKLRAERNQASDNIARMKKEKKDVPPDVFSALKETSQRIKVLEDELKSVEPRINDCLLMIPNLPHESVPAGHGSDDNPETRRWGTPPVFSFQIGRASCRERV